MATNPLEKALSAHKNYDKSLYALQRKAVGPRGILRRAHRRWKALVVQGLAEGGLMGALMAHDEVAEEVLSSVRALFSGARAAGESYALRQLMAYGADVGNGASASVEHESRLSMLEQQAIDAVETRLDLVKSQLRVMVAQVGQDEGELRDRLERYDGIWSVRHDMAYFLSALAAGAVEAWLGWAVINFILPKARPGGDGWKKQAVAAIDHRTTETCLLVHGQVQPLDGKFVLRGTPRFADRMYWTPFHWYCRTSVVLYDEAYDDGLTEQMRAAAQEELKARKGKGAKSRGKYSSALVG